MTRFLFLPVLAVAVAFLPSCASIIKKPEINAVRTVAIASLFADENVVFKHGPGRHNQWQPATKERVAVAAHEAFREALKKIGWSVLPVEKVVGNELYQREFGRTDAGQDANLLQKGLAAAQRMHNAQFFTLPKMTPIRWDDRGNGPKRGTASIDIVDLSLRRQRTMPEKLEALSAALGVDAVLLVEMDYCYGDGISVAGNGEAYILAQARLYAVNQRGQEIVTMPLPKRCETRPYGGKSLGSTGIMGGNLIWGDAHQTEKMIGLFEQATRAAAKSVATELDRLMRTQ